MKIGQRVEVLNHEKAKDWHLALVGRVTTVTGVSFLSQTYGTMYDIADAQWPIAGICLRPVDDDADYELFMERVMKPVKLDQPVTA